MDYAVHLLDEGNNPLDPVDAKKEIEDMGYIFKGNIADLPGYYLVGKPIHKRDVDESEIENDFIDSDKIKWFEKQVGKKRERRALKEPTNLFDDELYKSSWHLNKELAPLGIQAVDMNILPVWNKLLHGNGIRITVVDDGLDYSHPDLIGAFEADASKDILLDVADVKPKNEMVDHHGTRCAAEIVGAPNNKKCGVGVAYNARISGVTIIGDRFPTDSDEASAFKYHSQSQHIFSMSWGPSDDGTQIDGPGRLASLALEDGIKNGRDGKGLIFVIASGNGGQTFDNCNYDGYVNSMYTIAIGAVDIKGNKPWYSEECAAIHVVLPGGDENNPIMTSDINDLCSTGHYGTSAAAPLASGAIALLLEYRPDLGWRDVQQLLLQSTIKNSPNDKTWQINGANYHFHPYFGFGLLDTDKLIQLATTHEKLRDQHTFSFLNSAQTKIPNTLNSNITTTLSVSGIVGINTAEHIQIRVVVKHPRRGDLTFYLKSPMGTLTSLASKRQNDKSEQGLTWTFMTNRYWKETINGEWSLIIQDTPSISNMPQNGKEEAIRATGVLREWEMTIHGECAVDYCLDPQIQQPDPANWAAFFIFIGIFVFFGFISFVYLKYIRPRRENKKYSEMSNSISLQNIKLFKDEEYMKESPIEIKSPSQLPFSNRQSTTGMVKSISTDSLNTREKRGFVSDAPLSPLSPANRSFSSNNLKRDSENLYRSTLKNK